MYAQRGASRWAAALARQTSRRLAAGKLMGGAPSLGRNTRAAAVLRSVGMPNRDVMRHLCIAIASSALLLVVGASPDRAGAQGVTPPPPGYEPLPYAYGPPLGYGPHPEYGPPPPGYVPFPHAYGPPLGDGRPRHYGPPAP